MPSITTWNRLEPQSRSADVGEGSAAKVHDPLWLLARQWQVGEFQGEDAGTPVVARWRAQVATLSRCHLGALGPDSRVQAQRYDPAQVPLETMVERQPVRLAVAGTPADRLRLAVEAGQHFLRLLAQQPGCTRYRKAFVARYAVPSLDEAEREGLDAQTVAFADLVAGRALDARRLRAALVPANGHKAKLDPALKVRASDVAEVEMACAAWLDWSDTLFSQPAGDAPAAWQRERMEYAFSVAARLSPDRFAERTLSASEYYDGILDWYAFDLNQEVALGTEGDAPGAEVTRTVVPAPVSFRGVPAPRFWEFEDARVDVGLMQVGPTDLPHLLLIDYTGSFGNDWYVIPIDLPVGSLAQTTSLVVTDTFGVRTLLRPHGDATLAPAPWSLFQLAQGHDGAPVSNLFFLPPTLVKSIEGAPLEEVMLLRDEMANMAWAIERRIETPLEAPLDRGREAASHDPTLNSATIELPAATSADAPVLGAPPHYRLASRMPDYWVPLLPVRIDPDSPAVRLARAAVLALDGTPHIVRARGRLLVDETAPNARLLLHEEEVPREGAIVRRSYQAARWLDGSLFVWAGHRKSIGRGEGSSGLRFDSIEP